MNQPDITITDDRIFYTNKPTVIVMDKVETPLMKRFAEIVTQNGGDILEVGFGMGISPDFIYNSNIKSYTCIEIHPKIYTILISKMVNLVNNRNQTSYYEK